MYVGAGGDPLNDLIFSHQAGGGGGDGGGGGGGDGGCGCGGGVRVSQEEGGLLMYRLTCSSGIHRYSQVFTGIHRLK